MSCSLILCTDKNFGIGYENKIPWHSTEDFKHFKKETEDKIIVMGFNTWKSLPKKPLPNRLNIVLTDRAVEDSYLYKFEQNVLFLDSNSLEQIIRNNENCMIIGGAKIYEAALPYVDEIIHSTVTGKYKCDRFFDFTKNKSIILDRYKSKTLDDMTIVDYYWVKQKTK